MDKMDGILIDEDRIDLDETTQEIWNNDDNRNAESNNLKGEADKFRCTQQWNSSGWAKLMKTTFDSSDGPAELW